jgi:hypothetical protein
MANGVDTTMEQVKAAGLKPMRDRAPAETKRDQLLARHDAVLAPGQVGDPLIRSGLGPYIGPNPKSIGHGDSVPHKPSRVARGSCRN